MKNLLLFLLVLCYVSAVGQNIPQNPNVTDKNGLRQGKWTIWFTKNWETTSTKDSIAYYRLIEYKEDKPVGIVIDYYLSGKKQFEGQLLADRPEEVNEGNTVWYYQNGNKMKDVTYKEGKAISEVKEYAEDGSLIENWEQLNNKGVALYSAGKYGEAIPLFEKARAQAEREFGRLHPDYATSCNNLALLCQRQGLYAKAEPLFLEAKDIREKVLGKLHGEYATSCNNLAELFRNQGLYAKAEPLFLEAKNITEKVLSKLHPSYATSCNNLGLLYKSQGLYAKAEPLSLEAKNITEKVWGKLHPNYATSCDNLAALYRNQGLYTKAEPLFLEAKDIREKVLGKLHPDYAISCNNLAGFYNNQGLYAKAEPLYQEAKDIREKVLGKLHPSYAISCNNLALLYDHQGLYAKAESLYLEAKDITEKVWGKLHPDYAASCNNLAVFYERQRQYAKAEPLTLESKDIREKVLGKLHPDYAISCNNLAVLYERQDLYGKAEPLFLEAKDIREKVLGKLHPDYAISCNNLADIYQSQDLYAKAEPLYREALQTDFSLIENQLSHLSEKEKEAFIMTFNFHFEKFNSFVLKRKSQNPAIVSDMYNNLLVTKALLFNTQNKIRNNILASKNPALIQSFESWQTKRNALAKAYQMTSEEKQTRNIDITQLEDEANTLEKQLSVQSEVFATASEKKQYTWHDVQKTLKRNEAALEIVRFKWYNKKWTDTIYYAALLITPKSQLPDLIFFENGNELEKEKSLAFYRNSIKFKMEDDKSYNLFWKPMAERLKAISPKTSKVFFSADGVYHSINLQTLLNPQTGKYLTDEWDIQLVTSTKDLVTTKKKPNSARDASLFGYPDYGNKGEAASDSTRGFDVGYATPLTDSLKRDFANGRIPPLPGTEKEINEIQKSLVKKNWKTENYKLGQANENRLKAQRNPTVLHIATHGFFRKDVESDRNDRGFAGFDNQKFVENPLLRSGLLLAGSQQTFDGKTNLDEEDGILTAYEAMNLNLDNTDMVVLSACETGLGEIKNGEGVFGLQRAFQTAGAKSIIMSLWKVDDNATQELMQFFYDQWLLTGNKRLAFKQAQAILKNKYKYPYYWGAFVMVGE
jgi:CHAT domain-containing protein